MMSKLIMVPLLALLLAGCADSMTVPKSDDDTGKTGMTYEALSVSLSDGPQAVLSGDRPVLVWYDKERKLQMAAPGQSPIEVSAGSPTPSLLSYNKVLADGEHIYFAWRLKMATGAMSETTPGTRTTGNKHIYFRSSHDSGRTLGKLSLLNRGTGAMEPYLAANGRGNVYVAWNDERNGAFDIYANVSHDHGDSWLAEDVRLNTHVEPGSTASTPPRVVAQGDDVHVFWVQVTFIPSDDATEERPADEMKKEKDKKDRKRKGKTVRELISNVSRDGGMTWEGPRSIAQGFNIYDPRPVLAGERILVVWSGEASTNKVRWSLHGIASDDSGRTWNPLRLPAVDAGMLFELSTATDADGRVHIAFPLRPKIKAGIDSVYYLMSPDRGNTWTEPVRLPTNTLGNTHSSLPRIAVDGKGTVVVSWLDYRDIRGTIYTTISRDHGKTWLDSDLRVTDPSHAAEMPGNLVIDSTGRTFGSWLSHLDESRMNVNVVLKELPVDAGQSVKVAPADAAQLEKRVNQFWELRLKGDYGNTYSFLDPYTRQRTSQAAYSANLLGVIQYHSYEIKSIEITENIARVKVAYNFSIPDSVVMGRRINIDHRDDTMNEEWAWIDGDWYKVVINASKQSFIPFYPAFP